MTPASIPCLVLACGNTLRSDDGAGPWLAAWAEDRFAGEPAVRVVWRQQWTPDLAEDIAQAQSALFIDCSIESEPGSVQVVPVQAATPGETPATHHIEAAELLSLSKELYDSLPRCALLLTIGAGSIEMGETFSQSVNRALPEACRRLEAAVRRLLEQNPSDRALG